MDQYLVILLKESRITTGLSSYFEKREDVSFQVMPFNDYQKTIGFLQKNEEAVLILDEEYEELFHMEDEAFASKINIIIATSHKELEEYSENENRKVLFKYQSAEDLFQGIMRICASEENGLFMNRKNLLSRKETNCEIIGVYSPIHRCLQTSFSLVYCSLKSKKKKVLYINFEIFSGFAKWFEKTYGTDLMDLLYFVDSEPEKFLFRLAGMVENFGAVKYIPPAISYEDFMSVTAKQWIRMIEIIAEYSDYEVIVLDLGEHVQGLFSILEKCDKVFTITKQDRLAVAKVAAYEEMIHLMKKESILDKTQKCTFPVFKDVSRCADELPYSQLASYIKQYLKEEFE